MYRYFFIAKNNIKKQKSDMITFFILAMFAALLIYISVSFMLGAGRVYDTNKANINAADILVMVEDFDPLIAKTEEVIKGNIYLKNCEEQRFLKAFGAKYRKFNEKDWNEHPLDFFNIEDNYKMQTKSLKLDKLEENEIVIPASFMTSYSLGDTIQIEIGDYDYDLKVAGFNEDNIYCSPMNMGVYKTYVSEKMYEKIYFENSAKVTKCVYLASQLTDTAQKKKVDPNDISDEILEASSKWDNDFLEAFPDKVMEIDLIPEPMMKTASLILPLIFAALILLFAIIIMVIAIVIINFSVKNFIITNMKNTAIMEATGYTVKELIMILLCQLLLVAGTGSVIGTIIGAMLIDKLGVLILVTLGLSWNQPIYWECFGGVILGICLIVAILTVVLGNEYSKTSVLDALRGGINTHNFKKNHFPFDKSSMPISVTMALKETFGKFKSQIGIIFIMMILTIASVIAFGIADNYGNDDGLLELSGIDEYDAYCSGDDTMFNNIVSMPCVDHAYKDTIYAFKVYGKNNIMTPNIRTVSDTSMIKGGCVTEGRWPQNPNEIAFGSAAADRLGVNVGDVVKVKNNMVEESYIVSGVYQCFQNMGLTGMMTMEGAQKLTTVPTSVSINIFFKKGVSYEQFEKEFKSLYPDVDVYDYYVSVHQTVGMITIGMKGLAFFVAVLTCLIVAFVESLIVRTNINKQWRNLGVSKALGFTSGELIRQVMLSNIPSILIGIIIGLSVSQFAGSKLFKSAFMIFGFRKVAFDLEPMQYILTAIIIIGVALVTGAMVGRKIKELEPVKMIMEE